MTNPSIAIPQPTSIQIEGLSVRYVRAGMESGTPLLMTAPYPQSIYAFNRIWNAATKLGPVIAVDLPGFGMSEGSAALMSPAAMGDFMLRLMDALALERVHAIVPDVGTLAALFAASKAPDRFETIVGGSGGVSLDLLGEPLRQIVMSSHADFANMDGGEMVVGLVKQGARVTLPDEVLEDYRLSSQGPRWNAAAEFVRAYKRDLPQLARLLPLIDTQVLVISGKDDPFVPVSNGEYLEKQLPVCVAKVVDAGHFVWEDASQEYGELLARWVSADRTSRVRAVREA